VAQEFRATHRLVHRSSGTLADDLMEVSPGVYATESSWQKAAGSTFDLAGRLSTLDSSTLPSFDIVKIEGVTTVVGIDRDVAPGAPDVPATATVTLTSTAEEDGYCGPHGNKGRR